MRKISPENCFVEEINSFHTADSDSTRIKRPEVARNPKFRAPDIDSPKENPVSPAARHAPRALSPLASWGETEKKMVWDGGREGGRRKTVDDDGHGVGKSGRERLKAEGSTARGEGKKIQARITPCLGGRTGQ